MAELVLNSPISKDGSAPKVPAAAATMAVSPAVTANDASAASAPPKLAACVCVDFALALSLGGPAALLPCTGNPAAPALVLRPCAGVCASELPLASV